MDLPQKMAVGSRSISDSRSSTRADGATRSYSWNRKFLSRQSSDHVLLVLMQRSLAIGERVHSGAQILAPRWGGTPGSSGDAAGLPQPARDEPEDQRGKSGVDDGVVVGGREIADKREHTKRDHPARNQPSPG